MVNRIADPLGKLSHHGRSQVARFKDIIFSWDDCSDLCGSLIYGTGYTVTAVSMKAHKRSVAPFLHQLHALTKGIKLRLVEPLLIAYVKTVGI